MERILFGDNQFFGINHFSEEKARQQAMKFQDVAAILDVLQSALGAGAKGFMCTTHDTVGRIADEVRAHPDKWDGFRFYPGMPYAHKYANAVTELGYMGALKKFIPSGGMFDTLTRGTRAVLGKDIEAAYRLTNKSERSAALNSAREKAKEAFADAEPQEQLVAAKQVKSLEADVKSVVNKVTLGEADVAARAKVSKTTRAKAGDGFTSSSRNSSSMTGHLLAGSPSEPSSTSAWRSSTLSPASRFFVRNTKTTRARMRRRTPGYRAAGARPGGRRGCRPRARRRPTS